MSLKNRIITVVVLVAAYLSGSARVLLKMADKADHQTTLADRGDSAEGSGSGATTHG